MCSFSLCYLFCSKWRKTFTLWRWEINYFIDTKDITFNNLYSHISFDAAGLCYRYDGPSCSIQGKRVLNLLVTWWMWWFSWASSTFHSRRRTLVKHINFDTPPLTISNWAMLLFNNHTWLNLCSIEFTAVMSSEHQV